MSIKKILITWLILQVFFLQIKTNIQNEAENVVNSTDDNKQTEDEKFIQSINSNVNYGEEKDWD